MTIQKAKAEVARRPEATAVGMTKTAENFDSLGSSSSEDTLKRLTTEVHWFAKSFVMFFLIIITYSLAGKSRADAFVVKCICISRLIIMISMLKLTIQLKNLA